MKIKIRRDREDVVRYKIDKAIRHLVRKHKLIGGVISNFKVVAGRFPKYPLPSEYAMGIMRKGKKEYLIYNADTIERKGIQTVEIKSMVYHEMLHKMLKHWERIGDRERDRWNLAADIVIQNIITKEGMPLFGQVVPVNDKLEITGNKKYTDSDGNQRMAVERYVIKNISKKTAEEIYDEILEFEKKSGCEIGSNQIKYNSPQIKGNRNQSVNAGKNKGDVNSMQSDFDEASLDWRRILRKYIQKNMPYNYTYLHPNKKSASSGYYMPDYSRERVEIVVAIDTSGSIDVRTFRDFMAEVQKIAEIFGDKLKITVISGDVAVRDVRIVENGNIELIRGMPIIGGGGTSHTPIFHYIRDECHNCKLAIFFTDCESNLKSIDFKDYGFDKIFIVPKEYCKKYIEYKINNGECQAFVLEEKNG